MCYQTIIAYFLDLVRIPITLFNMSIINIILITILWVVYFFKIKKFQSYTIKKRDIIFLIILLIINIPILYRQYGILENFRYISTDSVTAGYLQFRYRGQMHRYPSKKAALWLRRSMFGQKAAIFPCKCGPHVLN